jgi:hypothetical protein
LPIRRDATAEDTTAPAGHSGDAAENRPTAGVGSPARPVWLKNCRLRLK